MPLRAALSADPPHGLVGNVDRDHFAADRRQGQRKAPVVAEGIERAAPGVASRGHAVLALVEKQPGLLAVVRIDDIPGSPFANLDAFGHRAVQHGHRLLETLEKPNPWIVPGQNARRLQSLDEQARQVRQQAIDALHERLQHEIVAIAIDDEPRQAIGFAVDQPVGGRIDGQGLAIGNGGIQPRAPRLERGGIVPAGHQPQRDFRSVAVQRVAERSSCAGP